MCLRDRSSHFTLGSDGKGPCGGKITWRMGSVYIATMMRYHLRFSLWDSRPEKNLLDGGCPWYDVYECKGGGYMAVGALEPKCFVERLRGLDIGEDLLQRREDRSTYLAGDEKSFSATLP